MWKHVYATCSFPLSAGNVLVSLGQPVIKTIRWCVCLSPAPQSGLGLFYLLQKHSVFTDSSVQHTDHWLWLGSYRFFICSFNMNSTCFTLFSLFFFNFRHKLDFLRNRIHVGTCVRCKRLHRGNHQSFHSWAHTQSYGAATFTQTSQQWCPTYGPGTQASFHEDQ